MIFASALAAVATAVTAVQGSAQFRPDANTKWQTVTVNLDASEGVEFRTGPKGTIQFTVGSDQVYRVEWGENSIYSPPNHWFHQHFNTGPGPARHIAVHAEHFPLGVHSLTEADGESSLLHRSFKEGGTLIDYEDERLGYVASGVPASRAAG